MAENKSQMIDLTEFVQSVEQGEWGAAVETGGPSVVVYSQSQGWREKEPGDTGWPFMSDGAGEQRVGRTWWDGDTNTIVVIVD
jgi:hypothetical protein